MIKEEKVISALDSFLDDQQTAEVMMSLYERWQDEKEYEDFDEYVKVMKQYFKMPELIEKGSKRPFGFIIKANNFRILCGIKVQGENYNLFYRQAK